MKVLQEYKLPPPGSYAWVATGPSEPQQHPVWFVVASEEKHHPGPWVEYRVMLLGNERLWLHEVEKVDFHNNWHVLIP